MKNSDCNETRGVLLLGFSAYWILGVVSRSGPLTIILLDYENALLTIQKTQGWSREYKADYTRRVGVGTLGGA